MDRCRDGMGVDHPSIDHIPFRSMFARPHPAHTHTHPLPLPPPPPHTRVAQAHGHEYMVLLDAGSTGTRVHVFEFLHGAHGGAYPSVRLPEPKYKLEPGLSSFADNPAAVVAALQPLLAFARHHVPPDMHAFTPVWLMATAGVRQLTRDQQQHIMAACRQAQA